MSPAAAEELRLAHAASMLEAAQARPPGVRCPKAELFQMALWRHRDEIVQAVIEREAIDVLVDDAFDALRPFARLVAALPPGENPVLISIPVAGGRDFLQLRPQHFRRAAAILGLPS